MSVILTLLTLFWCFNMERVEAKECVNIYFDKGPQSHESLQKTYTVFLQNLLGHFPEVQQILSPIESYQSGDIELCRASIYIGSYFDNHLPEAFLKDFTTSRRNLAWVGYSIWRLGKDRLQKIFGHTYEGMVAANTEVRIGPDDRPSFFQDILYKGEVFRKFASWSPGNPPVFIGPFEQVRLKPTLAERTQVLAQARQSGTGEIIPYALRSGNRFYIAEIPFSYIHEADRYLVFADMLFDILDLPPRHLTRPAVLKIDSFHALSALGLYKAVIKALREERIPVNLAVVPIFFDPLYVYDRKPYEEFLPIGFKPEALSLLHSLRKTPTTFLWNGVTHQYGRSKNAFSGATPHDFEFWDGVNNTAIQGESALSIVDRLQQGLHFWRSADLEDPLIWLTPNNQASALGYHVFARVHPWNFGRIMYFPHQLSGASKIENPAELWLTSHAQDAFDNRRRYFSAMHVDVPEYARGNPQFFPYELYADIYGQRVIPENLGTLIARSGPGLPGRRLVDDLLADAKRNLVIRDAWASLSFNPSLTLPFDRGGLGEYPGDTRELRRLLRGLRSLGYEFIDLKIFASQRPLPLSSSPIYRE